MKFSRVARPCCGHGVEVSYDGYCTLLTCACVCRSHCNHLQVTVPGEARIAERLHGEPLFGWCRACRMKVDDRHIRSLRPQRDARAAIYWLGEADDSQEILDSLAAASEEAAEPQLTLF